jgi:hypothetical protein
MEMSGLFHTLAALPQGKIPRHTLDSRLGGPLSHYGRCGEEKNILPAPGIELRPFRP